MKRTSKILLLALSMVLIVTLSVLGTVAWLTSQDSVINTFSVGQVKITMDETDVDLYGAKDGDARVKANQYKLVPGRTYVKDPTIHVDPSSEESWLFVKLQNGIAAIEDQNGSTIASQMTNLGWTCIDTPNGIYVYNEKVSGQSADRDIELFQQFTLSGSADVSGYGDATVSITAYAIQAAGFATYQDAWNALNSELDILTRS